MPHRRHRPHANNWETSQALGDLVQDGPNRTLPTDSWHVNNPPPGAATPTAVPLHLRTAFLASETEAKQSALWNLLGIDVRLSPNNPDEPEWRISRFLGAGAFGQVAAWECYDADGNCVDDIAIKQTRPTTRNGSIEASNQAKANHYGKCDNILHLRDFKTYLRNGQAPNPEYVARFYMEHAPYGDLCNLISRYRAFHRYLPEKFLWHVFDSLAAALVALTKINDSDAHMAHRDIKPSNIFLGYENPQTGGGVTEEPPYPAIKLADFGAALVTNEHNWDDHGLREAGTYLYAAPEQYQGWYRALGVGRDRDAREYFEQLANQRYGLNWEPSAFEWGSESASPLNVWGVARVMFELLALDHTGHIYVSPVHIALDIDTYREYGGHQWPTYEEAPFSYDQLRKKNPYSKELSDLIRQCLSVNPRHRPTAAVLKQRTGEALGRCNAKPEPQEVASVAREKLYYVGNTINDMPVEEKNCFHVLDAESYHELYESGRLLPDEPPLNIHPSQVGLDIDFVEGGLNYDNSQSHLEDVHHRRALMPAELLISKYHNHQIHLNSAGELVRGPPPAAAINPQKPQPPYEMFEQFWRTQLAKSKPPQDIQPILDQFWNEEWRAWVHFYLDEWDRWHHHAVGLQMITPLQHDEGFPERPQMQTQTAFDPENPDNPDPEPLQAASLALERAEDFFKLYTWPVLQRIGIEEEDSYFNFIMSARWAKDGTRERWENYIIVQNNVYVDRYTAERQAWLGRNPDQT